MSSSATRSALAAGSLFLLGGCSTTNSHIGDEDPFMGEAVKYNAAIQIINPAPVYPTESAQAGDSGIKGAAAVKRYRNDAVKDVQTMNTTSGSTGSGGSTPH